MIHLSLTCVSPVSVTEDMECRQRDLIVRLQELPELFPVTESPGHEARHQDTEPDRSSVVIIPFSHSNTYLKLTSSLPWWWSRQ